jgi:hypothetical protein
MLSVGGAAGGDEIVLDFSVQPQEMTEWCWAAVASSVAQYLSPDGSGPDQCRIAGGLLHKSCCTTPRPEACNATYELHLALDYVGCLRQMLTSEYLNVEDIAGELRAGLPIAIRVGWDNGEGHYLCIYGLQKTFEGVKLALSDPIFGDGAMLWSALIGGGYQGAGGGWTDTYVLQR